MRRPVPNAGKANVLGEATGACTLGAAGVGVQTRGEGLAEITSGRACAQQWLAASCKDRPREAMPKPDGGQQVWRMSPYERRRRGNAFPEGRVCLPRGGNDKARQRGSGHLAVPGRFLDTEPRRSRPSKRGRDDEQTSRKRGVRGPELKAMPRLGRLSKEKPRSEPDRGNPAVRDRRGACRNVDKMGAGLRPSGKPRHSPPRP